MAYHRPPVTSLLKFFYDLLFVISILFFFYFPETFFGSLNDRLAQLVLSLFWLCSSLDGTWPTTQPTVTSL
jgi:hypothetical protein